MYLWFVLILLERLCSRFLWLLDGPMVTSTGLISIFHNLFFWITGQPCSFMNLMGLLSRRPVRGHSDPDCVPNLMLASCKRISRSAITLVLVKQMHSVGGSTTCSLSLCFEVTLSILFEEVPKPDWFGARISTTGRSWSNACHHFDYSLPPCFLQRRLRHSA